MNVSLNNAHLPTEIAVGVPAEGVASAAAGGEKPTEAGLSVVEEKGAAPIPGEEPVDERALTRDDPVGALVNRAFATPATVLKDVGFVPTVDAGKTVAENIGKSADELKALFIRNREKAEEEARRLESQLEAEAAKAPAGDDRLDAMVREAELKV